MAGLGEMTAGLGSGLRSSMTVLLPILILCMIMVAVFFYIMKKKKFSEFTVIIADIDSDGNPQYHWDRAGWFVDKKSECLMFRCEKFSNIVSSMSAKDGKKESIPFKNIGRSKLVIVVKKGDQFTFLDMRYDKFAKQIVSNVTDSDVNGGVDWIRRGNELFKRMDWSKIAMGIFGIVAIASIVVVIVQLLNGQKDMVKSNAEIADSQARTAASLNSMVNATTVLVERVTYLTEAIGGVKMTGQNVTRVVVS